MIISSDKMTQITKRRSEDFMADIPRRLATICLGVPLLWRVFWWHETLRTLFFQGAHAVMCWEWARMTTQGGSNTLGMILFPLVSVACANCADDTLFFVLLLVAVFAVMLTSENTNLADPKTQLQATAGVLLITIPNRSWLTVSQQFAPTVSLLLTVWNCDTGALLAGRLLSGAMKGTTTTTTTRQQGKQQPDWLRQASPNKSVQGLCGGFLAGVVTFCILPWFWKFMEWLQFLPPGTVIELQSLNLWDRFRLGCALSLLAILGDLWESILKRTFEVKDTGSFLPGHGGLLDRFDSSLIAVMLYAHILKQEKDG